MHSTTDRLAQVLWDAAPACQGPLALLPWTAATELMARGDLSLLARDHGIWAFNERVLDWARRAQVPLLERLRYLCIVASNLDEFFAVRAARHIAALQSVTRPSPPHSSVSAASAGQDAALAQATGAGSASAAAAVLQQAQRLVAQQYALYHQTLLPDLHAQGIRIVTHQQRTAAQRRWVRAYFQRHVQPLLLPMALDPAHPFARVASQSLNMLVHLQAGPAHAHVLAIVGLPAILPRLIALPAHLSAGQRLFVSLSSMVRAHLGALFDGRAVLEAAQFRLTRHTALQVDADETDDLRSALRQALAQRSFGQAMRLEIGSQCSDFLANSLRQAFALPHAAVFRVPGPVHLGCLSALLDVVGAPDLRFAPFHGGWPQQLQVGASVMQHMRREDVLIHQPFEQFDAVLQLLREAVNDPCVLANKQTIYRTSANSELIALLSQAARMGKEVLVVVELQARLDEAANLQWADALEAAGAQVVYGVVGLKTHAKMLLITRREGRRLRRFGHLSTGNYNAKTARLYTDLSYLTCDASLTQDMEAVFGYLACRHAPPQLKHLVMAPFDLQARMLEHLQACSDAARQGLYARVVVKTNALTDVQLIEALVQAGQAGVRIDLIVRGACMLPPQRPGCTDNIRVRSIIGRFLEHSRVFYFAWGAQHERVYLSSADWMRRNMQRRVELAWPVLSPVLRQRVIDECLVAYLHDDRDAWHQKPDGSYCPPPRPQDGLGAQNALMQRYGAV